MAITFFRKPSTSVFLNAFNNNIVQFRSNSSGVTPLSATITYGSVTIKLSPSFFNVKYSFQYNLKELFKTTVNSNNFRDDIHGTSLLSESDTDLTDTPVPTFEYIYQDSNVYRTMSIKFKITFTDGNSEEATEQFRVMRSLVQLEDYRKGLLNEYNQNHSLLLPLTQLNRKEYHVTYWEGLPFDIPLYSSRNQNVTLIHDGNDQEAVLTLRKGVNRFFISRGDTNLSYENVMPMNMGLNKLIIRAQASFKTDQTPDYDEIIVWLTKKEGVCGPYLKWFNGLGGWSYHLFQERELNRRTKSVGSFESNYEDVGRTHESSVNMGVKSSDTIKCFDTNLTENEKSVINTMLESPKIYRYLDLPTQKVEARSWLSTTLKTSNATLKDSKKNAYDVILELNKTNREQMTF